MLKTQDPQVARPDPPVLFACPLEAPVEGAKDPEHVELSEIQQRLLHKTLYKSYGVAPVETGLNWSAQNTSACACDDETLNQPYAAAHAEIGYIDVDADAQDYDPVLCDFLRRAELLGVKPSEWLELSKRTISDIETFLKAEERPNDPGASSSEA